MESRVVRASRRRLFLGVGEEVPDFNILWHSERSQEFFDLRNAMLPEAFEALTRVSDDARRDFDYHCRIRKVIGGMRYGLMHAPGKPRYDRCASMCHRHDLFLQDHNLEHWADIANIAELEFAEGGGHTKGSDESLAWVVWVSSSAKYLVEHDTMHYWLKLYRMNHDRTWLALVHMLAEQCYHELPGQRLAQENGHHTSERT